MEFSGRGELSERQQKLGQHLGHLVRLAEEFNIAIVVVSFFCIVFDCASEICKKVQFDAYSPALTRFVL